MSTFVPDIDQVILIEIFWSTSRETARVEDYRALQGRYQILLKLTLFREKEMTQLQVLVLQRRIVISLYHCQALNEIFNTVFRTPSAAPASRSKRVVPSGTVRVEQDSVAFPVVRCVRPHAIVSDIVLVRALTGGDARTRNSSSQGSLVDREPIARSATRNHTTGDAFDRVPRIRHAREIKSLSARVS